MSYRARNKDKHRQMAILDSPEEQCLWAPSTTAGPKDPLLRPVPTSVTGSKDGGWSGCKPLKTLRGWGQWLLPTHIEVLHHFKTSSVPQVCIS